MRSRYRYPIGGSLAVVACLAATPAARPQTSDRIPGKVDAWIGAAYAHKAGELDEATERIAVWSRDDLRTVFGAATGQFQAIEEGRATNRSSAYPYIVMFRRYGITDRASFNRALRLIAFLHADIAVLHKTREGYALPPDDRRILEFEDGRQTAQVSGTFHWEFGRSALERQVPRPTGDAFTRLWYRTTSAVLQQINDFSELAPPLVALTRGGRVLGVGSVPTFLSDLCEFTGGRALKPDAANLDSTFLTIFNEFRQRYLVSYTPRGVSTNGWHRLEVKLKGKRGTVRARPGYLAGT